MKLAILVPCWNHLYVTMKSIESLIENTVEQDSCIILVDDGSTDDTPMYANELQERLGIERFHYHRNSENMGVTFSWNAGVRIAGAREARFIGILNNDLLFTRGWEQPLMRALEADHSLAVVSPMSTAGRTPGDWPAGTHRGPNPAGYSGYMPILGAAFMCRTALFAEIGLFPPEMKHYFGDNWIVLASQAKGYECGYAQESYVHHLFCQTTTGLDYPSSRDALVYERIAKELGVQMRPWLTREGERYQDLPVTGVK